jgi:hypothetical protein
MEIDMRRDDRPRSRQPNAGVWPTGTVGRAKKAVDLKSEFLGISLVNSAYMRSATRWAPEKLIENGVPMGGETLAMQVVIPVKRIDEVFKLIGKQHMPKLFAERSLNVYERMPSVQVRQKEISHRGEHQRAGKVKRIFEIYEGFSVLFNGNGFHGP